MHERELFTLKWMFSAFQFGNDYVRSKQIIITSFALPPPLCDRCHRAHFFILTAVIILGSWFLCKPARARLVDAFDNIFLHCAERADFRDAVPWVGRAGFAADRFVALEEARHEELAGHGGEFDAAPFAVIFELIGLVGIDDAKDSARLGRMISDGEIVFGLERAAGGEAHEGVAVCGRE